MSVEPSRDLRLRTLRRRRAGQRSAIVALILFATASARAAEEDPQTSADRSAAAPASAVATSGTASTSAPPPLETVASAAREAFGIQTGFGGGRAPTYSPVPGAVENAPSPIGTIGVSYFASDTWALVGEAGLGVALAGGEPRVGITVGVGTDYYFRTRHDALPLLHGGLLVERRPPNDLKNDGQELPWIEAQVGGGAAYFLHPRFSIACRVGVGVAWRGGLGATAPAGAVIVISTLLPAVQATWYL